MVSSMRGLIVVSLDETFHSVLVLLALFLRPLIRLLKRYHQLRDLVVSSLDETFHSILLFQCLQMELDSLKCLLTWMRPRQR